MSSLSASSSGSVHTSECVCVCVCVCVCYRCHLSVVVLAVKVSRPFSRKSVKLPHDSLGVTLKCLIAPGGVSLKQRTCQWLACDTEPLAIESHMGGMPHISLSLPLSLSLSLSLLLPVSLSLSLSVSLSISLRCSRRRGDGGVRPVGGGVRAGGAEGS